jgi:hypothetical protein
MRAIGFFAARRSAFVNLTSMCASCDLDGFFDSTHTILNGSFNRNIAIKQGASIQQ